MIKYFDGYWRDIDSVLAHIPNIEKLFGCSVLITGGTGLICSTLVEILLHLNESRSANIKIILAGRSKERTAKRFYLWECGRDYDFLYYDATQENEISLKVDYVINGASNASPAAYTKEPVETMLANILGLNSLLKMAVNGSSRRLLHVSSSEVYGKKESDEPYSESDYGFVDILNPRASYPCSKRAAETLCVSYGLEYNLDTVIVRPGHIYGPSITDSDDRASAQFTRNVLEGKNIVMKSAGTQLRSYCYTLDCASAILTVLLNGKSMEAYNISNRDSIVSIRDVAYAFANSANVDVVFENPTDLEKMGYNLMDNSSLDSTKLESLGWKAVFDLAQGSKCTLSYLEGQNV